MIARVLLASLLLAAGVSAAPPEKPVRVATLLPYVEDALGRLGPQVQVVAAVRRDLRQPVPPPAIDLGNPHSPSYERLAEAKPDLIVGERALHGAQKEKLARSGGEVLLVDASSVDATFDGLLEVGRRVGAGDAMAVQVAATRRTLDGETLDRPVPTLLVFGTPGSFLVISDRTWLGDLTRRMNLKNIGAAATGEEQHPGFVLVSDEVLAGLRPEIVLLVAHGDPESIRAAFVRRLDTGGAWAGLRTAATRGVHVLPPALFAANPGLQVGDAAKHLRGLVEPRLGRAP